MALKNTYLEGSILLCAFWSGDEIGNCCIVWRIYHSWVADLPQIRSTTIDPDHIGDPID